MPFVCASILSADFARLGEEVAAVERAGASWIHVDVMDGHFVPNLTMGPMTVEAVRRTTTLPIDVHLLIENPDLFVERFAKAGATHISVHAEASPDLARSLEIVRSHGARAGIAAGPACPLSRIAGALDRADYVDLLAVSPGFGGQAFIPSTMDKIRELRAEIDRRGLAAIIQSDGGINPQTIADFARAGVEAFVVGSALFGAGDYGSMVRELLGIAEGAKSRTRSD
jgi:ribulose-phosphate 3-epimerase